MPGERLGFQGIDVNLCRNSGEQKSPGACRDFNTAWDSSGFPTCDLLSRLAATPRKYHGHLQRRSKLWEEISCFCLYLVLGAAAAVGFAVAPCLETSWWLAGCRTPQCCWKSCSKSCCPRKVTSTRMIFDPKSFRNPVPIPVVARLQGLQTTKFSKLLENKKSCSHLNTRQAGPFTRGWHICFCEGSFCAWFSRVGLEAAHLLVLGLFKQHPLVPICCLTTVMVSVDTRWFSYNFIFLSRNNNFANCEWIKLSQPSLSHQLQWIMNNLNKRISLLLIGTRRYISLWPALYYLTDL